MTHPGVILLVFGAALVGVLPVVMLAAWIVRARHEPAGERPRARAASGTLSASLAVVALVALAAAWYVLASPGSVPPAPSDTASMDMQDAGGAPPSLPRTLAGMQRDHEVTGEAALEQVAQLHRNDFPVARAAIAHYDGPVGTAMVWVATPGGDDAASGMVRRMAGGISQGGSPFEPPRAFAPEPGVWITSGMGQTHYFFARSDAVWWLSVDSDIATRALDQLLRAASAR